MSTITEGKMRGNIKLPSDDKPTPPGLPPRPAPSTINKVQVPNPSQYHYVIELPQASLEAVRN